MMISTRRVAALIAKDFEENRGLIGLFLIVFVLYNPVLALACGRSQPVGWLLNTAAIFAIVSLGSYLKPLVWQERLQRTFCFLKTLPLSAGEVVFSKELSLVIVAFTTFHVPLWTGYFVLRWLQFDVATPSWIHALWYSVLLLTLSSVGLLTGIAFDTRKGLAVPYLLLLVLAIPVAILQRHSALWHTFAESFRASGRYYVAIAVAVLVSACHLASVSIFERMEGSEIDD